MKKVLALALAFVMAFSMSAMAFAADSVADTTAAPTTAAPTTTADVSIMGLLDMLVDIIKASFSQWDAIESVVIRLVDFIENIGSAAVSEADVKGAVADLEAALADAKIPGVSDILNQIKQKIKDLYAGEVATTVEVTTEIAPPADTGSSSVGIAVFAAVSVAAAAAYVCTKKSK